MNTPLHHSTPTYNSIHTFESNVCTNNLKPFTRDFERIQTGEYKATDNYEIEGKVKELDDLIRQLNFFLKNMQEIQKRVCLKIYNFFRSIICFSILTSKIMH